MGYVPNNVAAAAQQTRDSETVRTGCPPALQERLQRIKRHAETETRAGEQAVWARQTAEVTTLNTLVAEGRLSGAESTRRYAESYDRLKAGEAQVKAAWGLGEEAAVRQEAEEAALSAIASVWERHVAQLEERFV